jgi:hypothetical protein
MYQVVVFSRTRGTGEEIGILVEYKYFIFYSFFQLQ